MISLLHLVSLTVCLMSLIKEQFMNNSQTDYAITRMLLEGCFPPVDMMFAWLKQQTTACLSYLPKLNSGKDEGLSLLGGDFDSEYGVTDMTFRWSPEYLVDKTKSCPLSVCGCKCECEHTHELAWLPCIDTRWPFPSWPMEEFSWQDPFLFMVSV